MIAKGSFVEAFRDRDLYVPHFEVRLEGRELKKDVIRDVIQVTYSDNVDQIDSFNLTINNWGADTRQLKYTDSDLFDPGKKLKLSMGYRERGKDDMRTMLTGTIKSLRLTYPASGGPQLAVSGVNLLDDFRGKQETHVYEKKKDSQIAKAVAGRLGVDIRIKPVADENEHEYLLQDNKLDIVFLMERARALDYDLLVEENDKGKSQLYFGPSERSPMKSYDLKYGLSLTQFTTTLNTANQVSKVVVTAAHPKDKTKIKETATRSQLDIQTLDNGSRLAGLERRVFEKREEVKANQTVQTPQEAKTLAKRTLERIAKDFIKGSGGTVGLPDLRAGRFVNIHGIGNHFSGRYFVTATTHTIGSGGYTTQFHCRRE